MARNCSLCGRPFPTRRGLAQHRSHYHAHPKPPPPASTFRYHPHLTGMPCDAEGHNLPPGAPPPPRDNANTWAPFPDRPTFEFAEHLFEKMETSEGDVKHLLDILRARDVLHGAEDLPPFFESVAQYHAAIDAIAHGETNWQSVALRYTGPVGTNAPAWKRRTYVLHYRDALAAVRAMASSADFEGKFHTTPFEEHIDTPNGGQTRRVSDMFSAHCGQFLSLTATQDEIAQDANTHGALLVPIILGADKTTVSVATGNQEFHPLYMSLGNIHNDLRRAHREAVVPLAFLPIPKGERDTADTDEFRIFKKQLYHTAIAYVLSSLRQGMTVPEVIRCPDGHFRRAVFELGPFIADYPEQVYLGGIVSGWCPKCLARPSELDNIGPPRFRELTMDCRHLCPPDIAWDAFGISADVTPFTEYFPRADIHELLTPDLLHQLIKGTFKDHVVAWVEEYIHTTAETEAEAKRILDDIDRRIAAAPPFPGLRRFPDGRNFSQWTGNDSKALMKVFLPAIVGYVPDDMVRCIAVLLDFTYLARRSSHTAEDLENMTACLAEYHHLRQIFEDVGIRPDGFSLPRQHALVHYVRAIQLFGSPNGLCSSITESRHISAVKRPWRRSSRKAALQQILRNLTRLSKLAAFRVDLARRGMLLQGVYQHARRLAGHDDDPDPDELADARYQQEAEAMAAEEPYAFSRRLDVLMPQLKQPRLVDHLRRFLHDTLYPELELADDLDVNDCPEIPPKVRIAVYTSARSLFYAPSEASGPGGMHQQYIRCNPTWNGGQPRYDTVLVRTEDEALGMLGMTVARVRMFVSFVYDYTRHEGALVEWFTLDGDQPDPVTGMWVVKPEVYHGQQSTSIIPLSSIIRACHLMPVYNHTRIPKSFHFTQTLGSFRRYYVNWFIDYHAHETII
ncbi:hypothetical protein C8Q76DRAFT_771056 [Earliella scabrosa]|nr:hypothetical protein C8Q76DRAFT_771056 [Earliella scabrosa]